MTLRSLSTCHALPALVATPSCDPHLTAKHNQTLKPHGLLVLVYSGRGAEREHDASGSSPRWGAAVRVVPRRRPCKPDPSSEQCAAAGADAPEDHCADNALDMLKTGPGCDFGVAICAALLNDCRDKGQVQPDWNRPSVARNRRKSARRGPKSIKLNPESTKRRPKSTSIGMNAVLFSPGSTKCGPMLAKVNRTGLGNGPSWPNFDHVWAEFGPMWAIRGGGRNTNLER